MATTVFTFYTVAWQGQDGISAPGTATPLADNQAGAVGTSTNFARQDHRHPIDIEEIGVGTGGTDKIRPAYQAMSIVRSFARRQGDLCVFSFVVDISSAPGAGNTLFELDESLAPPEDAEIDFVMIDGSRVAHFGKMNAVTYIPAQGDPYRVGLISCVSPLPVGTARGQVVWSIV